MEKYISKDALVAEIEKRAIEAGLHDGVIAETRVDECNAILSFIDTLEVKEVNEVPATVMVNKYGNRFIFSWSGLEEYDDLKKGEEIKILIPKK